MKSVNGVLFIIVGVFIIWIGATGRFPALAAAIGMIKQAPSGTTPSGGTGAQPSIIPKTEFPLATTTPTSTQAPAAKQDWLFGPALGPWKDVLGIK